MFGRRRSEFDASGPGALATIRDVVEIVAILAAGVWAFYTFVYENQIKPANAQPEAQVEGSLTRLGTRHGLIAIGSHVKITNVGTTDIWMFGFAETVLGANVRPSPHGAAADDTGIAILDEPDWTSSSPTRVFGFAELTQLADEHSAHVIDLRAGQSLPLDRVFYVTAGRFDELETNFSLRYDSRPDAKPFHLATVAGFVVVAPNGKRDANGFDGSFATLSLWR